MKKIIFGTLALILSTVLTVHAQEATQDKAAAATSEQRIKFFYYPSNNVYYNEASSEYLYYDEPSSTWMTVKQLPTMIVLEPTAMKYAVYSNNKEIWKENNAHKTKYKVKKDGTVQQKTKTKD